MARQSILDRFRPVAAPGPGGSTGVPSDDDRGPEWELAPVFAALAPAIHAADAAIADAERSAHELIAAATAQATQTAEQARVEASSVRAAAAARVLSEAQIKDTANLTAAKKRATSLARRAGRHVPAAATRVIAALTAEVTQS